MDRNDLLKQLDLDSPTPLPEAFSDREVPALATEGASPTALAVDEWGLRRGRQMREESERMQALGLDAFAVADFAAAAFEPEPVLLAGCIDAQRHAFLTALLETPEYRALHAATALKPLPAELAAAAFAEQFAELRKDEGAGGQKLEEGETCKAIPGEMAVLKRVGRALIKAREDVDEAGDIAAAFGLGGGSAGGERDVQAMADLFKRIRADPMLVRICTLAGRYRRLAQAKQRGRVDHGLDDVVGVEPGRDIGRLLPVELAKFAIPELEDDLLRRLGEGQALCREYHSIEPVGKGPILIVLDESGSMRGSKIETGKALALALAWIARRQKRWAGLVAYAGDTGHRLLALPPQKWDESRLCDWLADFVGGGSSLDLPIRELPEFFRQIGAPQGQTDVVMVTDAVCRIPTGDRLNFLLWKKAVSARVTALVLDNPPGDLEALCDEWHTVASLDAGEEAVGRVLSL